MQKTEYNCEIKQPFFVHPTAQLIGKNTIGAGAQIGAFCVVEDCKIEAGAKVDFCSHLRRANVGKNSIIFHSMIEDCKVFEMCKIYNSNMYKNVQIGANTLVRNSEIYDDIIVGENATIGVFSHIHNGCKIGDFVRVGNFVELKKTTICDGAKCAHLAYLGDGEIGENSNIGAGTIFCNYDGKIKSKTRVGARCFVGSNCTLIAPLSIGDDCFIGADSCVVDDLANGTFFVRRSNATKQRRCKK